MNPQIFFKILFILTPKSPTRRDFMVEKSGKSEWSNISRLGTFKSRVSFETSFESRQPKLEPKLVMAPSETKCLFRLFRFYTKTESFDVSIEPKQTEDQPKQFDREHILQFFTEKLGFSRFFPVFFGFFGLFWNSLFWLFRFYTKTESFVWTKKNRRSTQTD